VPGAPAVGARIELLLLGAGDGDAGRQPGQGRGRGGGQLQERATIHASSLCRWYARLRSLLQSGNGWSEGGSRARCRPAPLAPALEQVYAWRVSLYPKTFISAVFVTKLNNVTSRPAVLFVDPEAARRRGIVALLAGFGYEVIPAVSPEEGRRYADHLGPGIVVSPAELVRGADGSIVERFASDRPAAEHTLLLLGRTDEEGRELPEDVLYLKADGLPLEDLVRRIHLVLLGREMGIEPDVDLESLVGDLELLPFLELLRVAERVRLTGRIVCADGGVVLDSGEVVAAAAGRAQGNQGVPAPEPARRRTVLGVAPPAGG